MAVSAIRSQTYLPTSAAVVAPVYDFLQAHEAAGRGPVEPRYFLAGSEVRDRVELPMEVYQVLRTVVEAMREGLAVTVAPVTKRLTTQQAAELLGVSRPTLVKLLDSGEIAFERTGTHRRVLLKDVLTYRQRRREEQYAALEATSVDVDDEEDLEETLVQLRAARKAVAARRRQNRPAAAPVTG